MNRNTSVIILVALVTVLIGFFWIAGTQTPSYVTSEVFVDCSINYGPYPGAVLDSECAAIIDGLERLEALENENMNLKAELAKCATEHTVTINGRC